MSIYIRPFIVYLFLTQQVLVFFILCLGVDWNIDILITTFLILLATTTKWPNQYVLFFYVQIALRIYGDFYTRTGKLRDIEEIFLRVINKTKKN
jgi:hypothetical protein